MARKNPLEKAPIDTVGMDEDMKATLFGTSMDKLEKAYLAAHPDSSSAMEAVRRARRANRRPPVKE